MNLAGIDVNLLVAFDVLLAERNVTQAAKRLGRTQPAMSNALARLRKLFSDPLLVRSARGMVPTRRALELAEPINRALSLLQCTLDSTSPFDPKASRWRFRAAVTDYVGVVLLPRLVSHLAVAAPHIDLETQPLDGKLPTDDLCSGRVDVAFGNFKQGISPPLRQEPLFKEDFTCVMRRSHSRGRRRLTVAEYVRVKHILVSPRGERSGIVDRLLASRGLERRVALTTSHFMVAPVLVAQTDLIATLPRRGAVAFGDLLRLQIAEPPIKLPGFTISMVWHGRTENEPASVWFREVVRRICREL